MNINEVIINGGAIVALILLFIFMYIDTKPHYKNGKG